MISHWDEAETGRAELGHLAAAWTVPRAGCSPGARSARTLHVEPTPVGREFGRQPEEHAVRRGHVASFPAGSALCHSFTAGDGGLVYFAYGTREPTDVIYYPRRNAMYVRGAGVMLPAERIGFLET